MEQNKTIYTHPIRAFHTSLFAASIGWDESQLETTLDQFRQDSRTRKFADGSWQTLPLTEFNPMIDDIVAQVSSVMGTVYNEIGLVKTPTLQRFWVNSHKTGQRNSNYADIHCHAEAYYSAVVYLKAPHACGNLILMRPDHLINHITFDVANDNNAAVYTVEPNPHKMIAFPGSMLHYVNDNLSTEADSERVSIAFDFR